MGIRSLRTRGNEQHSEGGIRNYALKFRERIPASKTDFSKNLVDWNNIRHWNRHWHDTRRSQVVGASILWYLQIYRHPIMLVRSCALSIWDFNTGGARLTRLSLSSIQQHRILYSLKAHSLLPNVLTYSWNKHSILRKPFVWVLIYMRTCNTLYSYRA